jgi:RNA polymerase sigma factor (sigma-70 family)
MISTSLRGTEGRLPLPGSKTAGMTESTTKELKILIDRLKAAQKAGDESARDAACWELLERAHGRLQGLVGGILGDFPRVKDDGLWKTTEVTAEVRVRLAEALRTVDLTDTTHFFRLAAQKIRWLLLDLVRCLPRSDRRDESDQIPGRLAPPVHDYQDILARLLEMVSKLPEEQYVILDLEFAFGFNDREIAAALDVDESTVRRRRRRAYEAIARELRETFPGLGGGLAASQQ